MLKCRLEPAEPGAAGLLHSLTTLTNGVGGPEFKPTLVNGMQLATEDAREAMRSMNIASRLRSLDCALVQGATDTLHLVLALRIASAHLSLNSAWRSLQVARGFVPSREVEI